MVLKRTLVSILCLCATGAWLVGCGDDDDGVTNPGAQYQALVDQFQLGPLPRTPYPDDNRFNAERVSLGRLLFFDPILGGESAPWIKSDNGLDPYRDRANDIACATCHHPTLAWADGRRLGGGVSGAQFSDLDLGPDRVLPGPSIITGEDVGLEPRNAPTILNAGLNGKNSITPTANSFQFMDGRVTEGLDKQAILPITSRDEMAGDAYGRDVLGDALTQQTIQDSVASRVAGIPEYVLRFQQAFPNEITDAGDITIDHVGRAIGAFEREIITPGSRYDEFVTGEWDIFNATEKRGFELFFGKGLCGDCHAGPMLSDFTFRIQGVGDEYDELVPGFPGKNGQGGDWGRFHADEVAFADAKFQFRVVTIRNVELTAPYFHSGNAGTLREVVEFYNSPTTEPLGFPDAVLADQGAFRDPSIRNLGLTDQEIDDIVAFMKTTTAPEQRGPLGTALNQVPERVPSGLVPPGIPTPAGAGPFYMTGQRLALQ